MRIPVETDYKDIVVGDNEVDRRFNPDLVVLKVEDSPMGLTSGLALRLAAALMDVAKHVKLTPQ